MILELLDLFIYRDKVEKLLKPSWADIENAISSLDGNSCSEVVFGFGVEENYMGIGGGEDGEYLANVTFDGETFHNLVDLTRPEDEDVYIVWGGQGADYPSRLVVGYDAVIRAAKTFAEHGTLNPTVTWSDEY